PQQMNQARPGLRPEKSSAPQETQGRRLGGSPRTPAHSADGSLIRKYPRRHSAVCSRSPRSSEAHCAACGGQTPAAPDAEKDRIGEARELAASPPRTAATNASQQRRICSLEGAVLATGAGGGGKLRPRRGSLRPRAAGSPVAAADVQPTATKELADALARVRAARSTRRFGAPFFSGGRHV
ncbi:uncharacterized protein Tco025E_10052, partial [Trypanosoma conorhini]